MFQSPSMHAEHDWAKLCRMELESPDTPSMAADDQEELSEARRRRAYIAVILNTIVVITLLWWFSRAFL